MNKQISLIISTLCLFFIQPVMALTYKVPSSGNVVGSYQKVTARGESLYQIAQKYDVGMAEIQRANPKIRLHVPLHGRTVTVPTRFTLPSGPRQGIVLNLAQMRIFYFHGGSVSTYPVGVGRTGWGTPRGNTRIASKTKNPSWRPPPSIRREAARKGKTLPLVVPPGPKNPLGHYAMHLGFPRIVIHGTNAPGSIGTRSSHGCIRMYGRDIQELFNKTAVGTSVRVQ